jgi:hypothetical protein
VRHITGHDADGKSVFLSTDIGDHHRELVDSSAIANILYSTSGNPVDLNKGTDMKFARENEVSFHAGQKKKGLHHTNPSLIGAGHHRPQRHGVPHG